MISRHRVSSAALRAGHQSKCVDARQLPESLDDNVKIVVVDLSSFDFGIMDASLRGQIRRSGTKLIGLYPHRQLATKEKAESLGFHELYPNAEFFKNTEQILRGP